MQNSTRKTLKIVSKSLVLVTCAVKTNSLYTSNNEADQNFISKLAIVFFN